MKFVSEAGIVKRAAPQRLSIEPFLIRANREDTGASHLERPIHR